MDVMLMPGVARSPSLRNHLYIKRAKFTKQRKVMNATRESSVIANINAAGMEKAAGAILCPLIEKAVREAGICVDDAYDFIIKFTNHLVAQVPELNQLFELMLLGVNAELLQQQIIKCAFVIREREEGQYKLWTMPLIEAGTIKYSGKGELF